MGCCYSTNQKIDTEVKRFRLLIIGKTGCGKTTILSKVCGENLADAPSTTRGQHNIEKEIAFETNDKLVAHDSEGFEAGKSDEVEVVKDFIERRCLVADINQQLHMVWYCIEMNSRPIQHAEREFFAMFWRVPVLAIVTKFDTFVQDVLQELEETAEEEGEEVDDFELERKATQLANERFNEHYSKPLMALPYPPRAVLALSDTHKSTPTDTRLAGLILETMKALGQTQTPEIQALFATAQTADVRTKLVWSICKGLSANKFEAFPAIDLLPVASIWNTPWSRLDRCQAFETKMKQYLNNRPQSIGSPRSEYAQVTSQWPPLRIQLCRYDQMLADTALVMEHLFLLKIETRSELEDLLRWYTQHSQTSQYVQHSIISEHQHRHEGRSGLRGKSLPDIVADRPLEIPDLKAR